MIIEFDIANPDAFEAIAMKAFEDARVPCQDAMATEFGRIAKNNFGEQGEDRPIGWVELSPRYAKRYHDGNRIPTLILRDEMRNSIMANVGEADDCHVVTRMEYAQIHQFGTDHVPARPFFPMDAAGQITPYTLERVMASAQDALNNL